MSKTKTPKLAFNRDALKNDTELLDCISLVTAVFLSTPRRPAVRDAFFATISSTATLLMAEDKTFETALTLLDNEALSKRKTAPSPVSQLVKPVKRKKAAAKKKARARGK